MFWCWERWLESPIRSGVMLFRPSIWVVSFKLNLHISASI
jgi:hypothetical protein